jgi:hypothetical protein
VRRLITALTALGALVVVGALASASGGATVTPLMPAYSGPLSRHDLQRRPYVIAISGDGSNFLAGRGQTARRPDTGRLTWTQWSAADGRGRGANWIDDCEPSCAQGTLHPYRITVHVYRPRRIAGHRLFTRLSITYVAGRPSYIKRRTTTLQLVYKSGLLFWNM